MKIYRSTDKNFEKQIAPLMNRSAFDPEIDKSVAAILADVKSNGDAALVKYAEKFDHVKLTPKQFEVSKAEFAAAEHSVSPKVMKALRLARAHIASFSKQSCPKAWSYKPRPGVVLGEKFTPMERVACYVPGGTAPLVSTVLHTVTIAATAGVKEIVVITPARADGSVNPAILCACKIAGATSVYRLGGVYGVAALAYGTETIRKVEKIVGPGNAYVTAAKRQLYGEVALDQVAGPSEILVIADETANPQFVAADLLSQAEHGSGREESILITTSDKLIADVQDAIREQCKERQRIHTIQRVLDNGTVFLKVRDLNEAAALASRFAPEHLELQVAQPRRLAPKITAAGAIFLGPWTPEPVGDFVAGPSHVLPTGGAAKYFSGLTIDMFYRRSSLVEYSRDALKKELPALLEFAAQEGLDGHGNSGAIRFLK
ncbi:MAG: histidinol dehydrogenase [Victivallales bacterium]|nr:histidinol dehydrogenase [Victivallales bacterium]